MSTIEERLARDIAAVTGGVVVTESDLQEAREVLEQNVDHRRWSRRRTAAVVVAAAVVIPFAGVAVAKSLDSDQSAPPVSHVSPSPSVHTVANDPALWLTGRAPTTALVQGVWRQDNGGVQLRFSPRGAFSSDALGRLFHDPGLVGTWRLGGDQITIDVTGGSAGCAGERFEVRTSLVEKGVLHVVPSVPAPARCSFLTQTWGVLEQVLPTSPTWAGLRNSDQEDWKPWPGRLPLTGLWMVEGGGYAMELGGDGTYDVVDESGESVDRGQWSYRDARLTLTSSGQSVECHRGDRLGWRDLQHLRFGSLAMRATVQQSACGAPWASRHWILVPDERASY
ncbi:MAG: hypothetical protein WAV00_22540 [Nocardioides sp.]